MAAVFYGAEGARPQRDAATARIHNGRNEAMGGCAALLTAPALSPMHRKYQVVPTRGVTLLPITRVLASISRLAHTRHWYD